MISIVNAVAMRTSINVIPDRLVRNTFTSRTERIESLIMESPLSFKEEIGSEQEPRKEKEEQIEG